MSDAFNKQPKKTDNKKRVPANNDGISAAVFQNYREILPTQFVDEILYSFVLCKYGDEGEELLDQLPAEADAKVRKALHDFFTELDNLAMMHIAQPG